MAEVSQSCCDEGGKNCVGTHGSMVPQTCPVGCALVFPQFEAVCHEHIKHEFGKKSVQFDNFQKKCLSQDALALVECE